MDGGRGGQAVTETLGSRSRTPCLIRDAQGFLEVTKPFPAYWYKGTIYLQCLPSGRVK